MSIPYKNVMAGQLNGPVIQSLLKAKHETFDEYGYELIAHRDNFSVDSATTEELNMLGLLCNIPRPYAVVGGVTVLASDADYKLFFKHVMALRQSQSLIGLAEVFYQFLPNGEFGLEINETTGDVRVILDVTFESYLPFLQQAAQSVYTASPQLQPFELRDYFYFIWDELLYVRYIQLAQPNVWTFDYDESTECITISATDDSLIYVGFDEGQLLDNGDGTYTPRSSCRDKAVTTYDVFANNLLYIKPMYKTYNDENSQQQTNGVAVFAKHPGVPDATPGEVYSVLYSPKELDKPLAPEHSNMAILVGYDSENHGLVLSNKALSPSGYFDNTTAPYGKGSEDSVQRSDLVYDSATHKISVDVFNVGRVPIVTVQQEG